MDNGPPPPPHGAHPKASGLPPGNYDIFIIPPHSSGSGFLYLPSLQPHRNSFLAGVACTLLVVGIWAIAIPAVKQWMSTVVASGGVGVILLVMGVGVIGWAFGKTQQENLGSVPKTGNAGGESGGSGSGANDHTGGPQYNYGSTPNASSSGFNSRPGPSFSAGTREGQYGGPKPTWQSANSAAGSAGWEKAREEMKKREEDRKKKEEIEKKAQEAVKRAQEAELKAKDVAQKAEQQAKEAAEKERWEKARVREREARERDAREKTSQEKLRKEREAKDAEPRNRGGSEHTHSTAAAAAAASAASSSKPYRKPTAQSFVDDEEIHSFRPYDTPSKRPVKSSSQSSVYSEPSSYAPSHSTSKTTPPRSHHGPYLTKDPDKIVIKAVYSFTDLFPKPVAQLVSGMGSVTDGLVLRITTEGMFIDDDVRGVPQREWDIKAWTMKVIETSAHTNGTLHILRATLRDADNKKYLFVIDEQEAWKVAVGLQKLRRGNLVRSLGVQGFSKGEAEKLVATLGWN